MRDEAAELNGGALTPPADKTPVMIHPTLKQAGVTGVNPGDELRQMMEKHPDGSVAPAGESVPAPTEMTEEIVSVTAKPSDEPDKNFGPSNPLRYSGIKKIINRK